MAKRKVEVFIAGCPVCDKTVKLVQSLACPNCEVVVYDLNKSYFSLTKRLPSQKN